MMTLALLNQLNPNQLNLECKACEIKGYSKLNKAQKVEVLSIHYGFIQPKVEVEPEDESQYYSYNLAISQLNQMTPNALKLVCKQYNIKGYSQFNRSALINLLLSSRKQIKQAA